MDFRSFSSSIGDSGDFEKELTLSAKLKVFKVNKFDPMAYLSDRCRHMSEKEIRHLCFYLIDLKKQSAEEMRKSVYASYAAFYTESACKTLLHDLKNYLILFAYAAHQGRFS